jgi:ATP-binding cassette subfamily B protein
VLDEATAYADAESEAEIQSALSDLLYGRTVIVIAHRLHTIAGADQILVLNAGTITERGTHKELLPLNGCYAALWKAHHQARAWSIPARHRKEVSGC